LGEPSGQNTRTVSAEQWFRAGKLFTGDSREPLKDQLVRIKDGLIDTIRPVGSDPADIDAPHFPIVAPGFIDLQINGAGGVFFNETPDQETLIQMASAASAGGTCHLLPTFITAPGRAYGQALAAITQSALPNILGVHLEGPFLSPEKPGIHPPEAIRPMRAEDVDILLGHLAQAGWSDGRRLLLTLAPEQNNAKFLGQLSEAGAIVFAGHSNATSAQLKSAIDCGLLGVTHLFNACSQIAAREPGIVGAALTDPRLFAGIIADGFHVAPQLLKLAAERMPGRLCLVSDTMPTYASDLTSFQIGDREITLIGKRLQASDGTLAGAHLGLDEAVANMMEFAGISLAEALHMASGVPARILGMEGRYGQIATGRPASLTCLSEDLKAIAVFVHGKRQ